MKPTQDFINMIMMFYSQRQKSISNADITKHNNQQTTFYSISKMLFEQNRLVSKTEPFSESVLIEIDKRCDSIIIGDQTAQITYNRTSPLVLEMVDGKPLIYCSVTSVQGGNKTFVKLMSMDGGVQIKLISENGNNQIIHNVCELPG